MNEDVFIVVIPGDETISTFHVKPLNLASNLGGNDVLL